MDLSGRFAFQHVSPFISKGLHQQTIGQLGGFWFFQATPVESTPLPPPVEVGGGGMSRRRSVSNNDMLQIAQILMLSGILDE